VDSYWLSMFLALFSCKKIILKVISIILFFCVVNVIVLVF